MAGVLAGGLGAVRTGGHLVRQARSAVVPSTTRTGGPSASGWLVVTVLRQPTDIDPSSLAPLAEMDDQIEVRVRPAPGNKGAELAARLRRPSGRGTVVQRLTGNDPEADLRSALRRAKQLLEVGEVLAVDPAPHGDRPSTPGGKLLEAWTRAAPGGGVR